MAAIINGHLPADPQAEFNYGTVLSVLIAARLSHPQGLVNVARWAAQSGAEFLWKIPAGKLNDDRLGRAWDAFFTQRHSILASLSLHVAQEFRLPLSELHFDPTALLFHGVYEDSTRGTYSVGHLARLYRDGFYALCAAPWDDYQDVFRQHRRTLCWKQASSLSQEQQRRRQQGNLSQEHYDWAVLRHAWTDPQTKQNIPGRLIFVCSTADQKVTRQHRQKQLARIREGLQDLARSVAEGRRNTPTMSSRGRWPCIRCF